MTSDQTIDSNTLGIIARQHLRTSHLMGIDFFPLGQRSAETLRSPEPSQQSNATRRITVPPPATPEAKAIALDELKRRHDAECPHCTAVTGHTQTVFGEGDAAAQLMFIGEAPGEEEDRTGRPFVGRAGQKLDDIIRAMGLTREQVYIANVLKSRPPNNRTPLPAEVALCAPYLVEQISNVRPKVIVSMGNPATHFLLGTTLGITRLRGTWQRYADPNRNFEVAVMPTFHPSYILRNYTAETRKMVWSDMQMVMDALKNFSQSGIHPLETRE